MIEDKVFKVFMLEDQPTDQELVKRQALKFNDKCIFMTANNKASFYEKIDVFQPDIILSDYSLPDILGTRALEYVKEHLPDVPFIFVTGAVDNDQEVAEIVFQGADGFLLKKHLSKLPTVMEDVIIKNDHRVKSARDAAEKTRKLKIKVLKLSEKLNALNLPKDSHQEIHDLIHELNSIV